MYWNNTEKKWLSQCGNVGNSKFIYSCPAIGVYGNYVAGRILDSSHYLLLTVDVQKKGDYTIVADPEVNNGFSFVSQGHFNVTGSQTLKVPAQGAPIRFLPNSNVFNVFTSQGVSNPLSSACTFNVDVLQSIADYSLNCSTATVSGNFMSGVRLTNSNKINVSVTVASLGSYDIFTEEINGIVFRARGVFTTLGRQEINLIGEGTPLVYDDFDITLFANSLTSAVVCKVKIPLILPPMTIGLIGLIGKTGLESDDSTDWTTENTNARFRALTNLNNFGENGIVKITSLDFIQYGSLGTQEGLLNELTTMLAVGQKPDVLIYNSSKISLNSSISVKLAEYVNKGGVLLFASENESVQKVKELVLNIFGVEYIPTKQIEGETAFTNTYPIRSDNSDPIINGLFGNTAGQNWGEEDHSKGSIVFSNLPLKSVQIAFAYNNVGKTTVDINSSIVWYNKEKGFVFFGDSTKSIKGPIANPSYSSYPSYYLEESNGVVPKPKTFGPGTTNNRLVFNSILEMNAVAWALRKAANEGINIH